jgi:predicted lipoprotein with Yx(FWY)xxD motif
MRLRVGALGASAGVALLVAACGSSASSQPTTTTGTATPAAATSAPADASAARLSLSAAKGSAGTFLVGSSGRAVYLWTADPRGMSKCSGACASEWPPVTTKGAPTAAGAVKAADLGTIKRSGGQKQVTYNGHPLYYFAGDQGSGSTNGQGSDGFGAKWWLVAPSGSAITGANVQSGAAAASTSSSGY